MHELHKKISDKIVQNNANYKLRMMLENDLKLLMLVIMWWFEFIRNGFL